MSAKIEGLAELERAIARLGKLPQKAVTKAARKGATPARGTARQLAPVDTGALKRAIILKGERSRKKGKKVFQVVIDPKQNATFVKAVKKPKHLKSNRAYYPASQEFGYFTRNGKYIPGFRYMERSLIKHRDQAQSTIIEVMTQEINKAWNSRG